MTRLCRRLFLGLLLVFLAANPFAGGALAQPATPSQPTQPTMGPGSDDYAYAKTASVTVGDAPTGATIFTPDGASPAQLDAMPIVLFIPGFLASNPETYGRWIDHLVRRGTIVLFPNYQTANLLAVPPETYPANLLAGVRSGVEYLTTLGIHDVRARSLHVVGHSLGAVLAVSYAQNAARLKFPRVATLSVIEPGGCGTCGTFPDITVPIDLNVQLPADILAQLVVGNDDTTVGDADARKLWPLFSDIPPRNRDYVTVRSDRHGKPPLLADHAMVGTGGGPNGEEDAMD
ncbi:MAG TPA: hypothetical protein VFQ54_04585, partial [Thermomicrobiales bacterium]|nr:hypothetical protein [Thermomicrobiales bacterium]